MSTYVYLACLDHTPPLIATEESDQHMHRDGVMEQIQRWVDNRETLVPMWHRSELDYSNYFLANTMRFLVQHEHCRVFAQSEYGDNVDMGFGVPVEPTAPPPEPKPLLPLDRDPAATEETADV